MNTQLEQAITTLEELSARWPQIMDAVVALRAALEQRAQDESVEYWTVADGWVSEQAEVPAAVWVEPDFWEHCNRFNCGTAYRLPAPGRKPLYTRPQPVPTSDTSQKPVDETAKHRHEPLTDEQKEILNFLLGASDIDDVWFGDKHPTEKGQFWWRNRLRKAFQKAAHGIKGEA